MAAPATIAAPTTTPLDSLQGLYDLINGKTTTTSGGTQTKTESSSISQDGMNEMLKSALSGVNGLASVAGGQRTAGGYGSATNQMLVNDLMTRTASQISQNNVSKTTSVSSTPSTTKVGGLETSGTAKLTALIGGLSALDKSSAAPWLKKQLGMETKSAPGDTGIAYTNPANESGNPNVYSSSDSNMVDASVGINSLNFDTQAGNPSAYSTSPASVDFSAPQDFSSLEGVGIDPVSVSSGAGMEGDPLEFLNGLADGGQVTGKKSTILGTSQYNQAARAAGGAETIADNAPSSPSSDVTAATPTSDIATRINSGNYGRLDSGAGLGISGAEATDNRSMASTAGIVSRLAGSLTDNRELSMAGTVLGVAGSSNPVAAAGLTAANIATNGVAGPAVSLAKDRSMSNVLDIAAAVSNPLFGVANTLADLVGVATIGQVAENAFGSVGVRDMVGPEQQAQIDADNSAASADLTSQANSMDGDAIDNLMGITGAFGTSSSGGAAQNNPGVGSAGNSGSAPGGGAADGRLINAPGDGTSDTKMVPLANGEYVLPADVVAAIGVDKLDALKDKYHTPVAVQKLQKFARG